VVLSLNVSSVRQHGRLQLQSVRLANVSGHLLDRLTVFNAGARLRLPKIRPREFRAHSLSIAVASTSRPIHLLLCWFQGAGHVHMSFTAVLTVRAVVCLPCTERLTSRPHPFVGLHCHPNNLRGLHTFSHAYMEQSAHIRLHCALTDLVEYRRQLKKYYRRTLSIELRVFDDQRVTVNFRNILLTSLTCLLLASEVSKILFVTVTLL